MPRPRRDGSPPKPRAKLRLTDRFVKTVAALGPDRTLSWDAVAPGLALAVQPSGHRSWRPRPAPAGGCGSSLSGEPMRSASTQTRAPGRATSSGR